MEKILFCVYDRVGEMFHDPFPAVKAGIVLRDFAKEVNSVNPDSVMAQHPGDFELWKLGVFDVNTGTLLPAKEKVCVLSDLVTKESKNVS